MDEVQRLQREAAAWRRLHRAAAAIDGDGPIRWCGSETWIGPSADELRRRLVVVAGALDELVRHARLAAARAEAEARAALARQRTVPRV